MNETEVRTIIDCLPKGKTKFYYYSERYASMLLRYGAGDCAPISVLKKTGYARLLEKQSVKKMLEKKGDGTVTPALLSSDWPRNYECYLLTLGVWGKGKRRIARHDQMTRCGYNLVLQLNFSQKHNRPYHKLVQPVERHPFENPRHPIAGAGYHTLAWSRLDINPDAGEALIEEVQNDWIRDALWMKKRAEWFLARQSGKAWADTYYSRGLGCQPQDIIRYVDSVLSDHIGLWDEAMLAATIWFLREELGIRKMYYHTFESGIKLKKMDASYGPPKSLYSSLPRRFCFEKTDCVPDWIISNRKRTRSIRKLRELRLWRLTL